MNTFLRRFFLSPMSHRRLIAYAALFFVLFYNFQFFGETVRVYPFFEGANALYIVSLAVVLFGVIYAPLVLIASKYTTKPLLIVLFTISSFAAYFMDTYRVVIDESMIQNVFQTDLAESLDLLSFELVAYVVFLGVLPSWAVYKVRLKDRGLRYEFFANLKAFLLVFVVIVATVALLGKFYSSFFREHKILRFYTNPPFWIDSSVHLVLQTYFQGEQTLKKIGEDAKALPTQRRRLVIMIVGEAVRADHLGVNGYKRATTEGIKTHNIVNLPNVYSCATSTAQSVPCMFSVYTRKEFDYDKALHTENVLDVLTHSAEVAVLWRDNNSNSKGVALRVAYESFKSPSKNTICDVECRDEGMLRNLDTFIEKNENKHVLIVLHQMGNHGPAYYKRYPQEATAYTPVCKTNQFESCTRESIVNAYDNALRYSDRFWSKTIEFAKRYKERDVAVIYMSDHGESLGEDGIYLHGLPYFIAPKAQKHIGAFFWFNENFAASIDVERFRRRAARPYSHDNLFHTLLGLFAIRTNVYDKTLDMLHQE